MRYLLAAAIALWGGANAAPLPDRLLVDYIEARIATGEYVGMIVGFFDETGEYQQAFGRVSKDDDAMPMAHTIFEISSVTKTFAATLLADAVGRGEMALHDPVNEYLPRGTRLAALRNDEVRLVDLAAHQSGLPNRPAIAATDTDVNPYANFDARDLAGAINAFEPQSLPGEGYEYSALGYAVLALALSTATEWSFEQLVQRRLTSVLGMADTVMQLRPEQMPRLARGYTPEGAIAQPLDQGALMAAGSMYSTLTDLMIWVRLHTATPDTKLGKAAKLTHAVRNETGHIGLAWHRTAGYDDRSHYGTANGYRAYVGFLVDGSKGAVILANTQANVQDLGNRLLLGTPLAQ